MSNQTSNDSATFFQHKNGSSCVIKDNFGNTFYVRTFDAPTTIPNETYKQIEADFHRQEKLAGPFIHPYRAINVTPNQIRLQRRFISGNSLSQILVKAGPLSYNDTLSIAFSISRSLIYLHQFNIYVHNLKPENIIINKNGFPYLVDFSISAIFDESFNSSLSLQNLIMQGPEGLLNSSNSKSASNDIYQFGMLIYIMRVGRLPWSTINIGKAFRQITHDGFEIPENVEPELKNLIKSMTKINPSERPTSKEVYQYLFNLQKCEKTVQGRKGLMRKRIAQKTFSAKEINNFLDFQKDISSFFEEDLSRIQASIAMKSGKWPSFPIDVTSQHF